jgi:excisionase family DNA binding protein
MNSSEMSTHTQSLPLPLRLLDEQAVAEMLGITRRHLRTLRSRRLIPFVKIGKSVRFDPNAVIAAVARLTVPARMEAR